MYSKILLATDGSNHSLKAAEHAVALAVKANSQIEILNVIQVTSADISYTSEDLSTKQGEEIIAATEKKLADSKISYTSKLLVGDPADIICHEAEKGNFDLIIIGSRGQTGITRFLLGSVSSKVAEHAPCPVMIVK